MCIRDRPRTILLDVPCSGLGTLARHPDLRTLRTPRQVAGLVDLQRRILDAVWSYLPSGGHLAYITCTMNPVSYTHRMATTVLTGWLMNINPLDQPAVELGKRLAYSRLGSSSYPEEAAILKAFLD